MDIKIAVLTLVKGRTDALLNLIKGLARNSTPILELIIVHMNEDSCVLPVTPFPVRSLTLYSEEKLPLAKARNLAMAQTTASHCVFLDVDCIPAENFIAAYRKAFMTKDCLWSGHVRYLRAGFPGLLEKTVLDQWSDADPVRSDLQTIPYELFWSLNFGCSTTVFNRIGGFDENYQGYGAEDTDFSFTARLRVVELSLVDAIAYHQPHASYNPPLNHLEDIVKNAVLFFNKWGRWPMEGWLSKFEGLGFISRKDDQLNILKIPAPEDIKKYLK